ncbi:MAG TPA: alpha/beta hydrolase, partial [Candidatus Dormibacteraeota bacterium]|nr:alpha/beta hydrolase [Candidatus Dormibacteraeota bacterium]
VMSCAPKNPIASHSPTPKAPAKLTWTDCGSGFQCANVTVPLDYANPDRGTIQIAINRKPATDQASRIGSLLINPGGPGDSGIQFLAQSTSEFQELNRVFDLVGFDPRGVGQSSPVRCQSPQQEDQFNSLDSVLDDPQEKQASIDAMKAIAAGCMQRSARILPYLDTPNVARDMDMIRAALGDTKLNYLGFSYGSFIGEHYAHIFPNHIRAMTLDGVLDPSVSANEMALAQVTNLEHNLQAWLADCRARKSGSSKCSYAQTGDPGTKLVSFLNRLDTTPMRVGSRLLTHGLALQGVIWPGLYYPIAWSELDQALTLAEQGNGGLLLAFTDLLYERRPDGSYSNAVDANLSNFCLDHPVPADVSAFDALAQQFASASPLFGPAYQYSNLQCSFWPVKPTGKIGPITSAGTPPILLVAGTDDPATPIDWARSVNQQLAGSVLLTRQGNGHISYDESSCAQAAEIGYLEHLTVPATGTVCS